MAEEEEEEEKDDKKKTIFNDPEKRKRTREKLAKHFQQSPATTSAVNRIRKKLGLKPL